MIITYILVAIFAAIFVFATLVQNSDDKKAKDYPHVSEAKTLEEERRLYKFYSCYSTRTAVTWRIYLFSSVILSLLIIFAFGAILKIPVSVEMTILIFLLNFLVFISTGNFLDVHVFSVSCNKVLDANVEAPGVEDIL